MFKINIVKRAYIPFHNVKFILDPTRFPHNENISFTLVYVRSTNMYETIDNFTGRLSGGTNKFTKENVEGKFQTGFWKKID